MAGKYDQMFGMTSKDYNEEAARDHRLSLLLRMASDVVEMRGLSLKELHGALVVAWKLGYTAEVDEEDQYDSQKIRDLNETISMNGAIAEIMHQISLLIGGDASMQDVIEASRKAWMAGREIGVQNGPRPSNAESGKTIEFIVGPPPEGA